MRQYGLHEARIAENVYFELTVRRFHGHALYCSQLAKAGVIHEYVDFPLCGYNMVHCHPDRLPISHIQLNRLDLVAAYLFQPMQAPCNSKYVIAIPRKKLSRGSSYAA